MHLWPDQNSLTPSSSKFIHYKKKQLDKSNPFLVIWIADSFEVDNQKWVVQTGISLDPVVVPLKPTELQLSKSGPQKKGEFPAYSWFAIPTLWIIAGGYYIKLYKCVVIHLCHGCVHHILTSDRLTDDYDYIIIIVISQSVNITTIT